ncbi:tripartite tricarboxylate transporter substrate binding protein [Arthrobacter subterraneus]|uniref:tripartite tricarboxylate transporter substrate binding protein n=1 Tax=Arthrobacter subterraneus TaxID=335973 RepID=UPI0037F909A9
MYTGGILLASTLALAACSGGGGSDSPTAGGAAAGECDISADFPSGPIELIVPFDAGGGTDAVGRLIANELSERLDEQVNVVNRTGGGGVVGHQAIANAAPDGRTIGMATAELAMLHHQGLTDVNPEDVTAISQMNADPAGITVTADAPYETIQDLLDAAEANPGELVASGTGQAGIWHVALAGLLMEAGLEPDAIRWVPSEGAAPALQELVAGGIDVSAASLAENRTMIDAERVKALAVMSAEPAPGFDDVPTLADEGIDYEMGTWRGIAGPAGMDEDTVAELECHLGDIAEAEEFTSFMEESGLNINYRNAEEFAAFMAEDDAAKGEILEAAGLAAK